MSASTASPTSTDRPATGMAGKDAPNGTGEVPLWRSGVLFGLTLLIICAYFYNPPVNIQSVAGVVMKLPVIVGDYFGKEGAITAAEQRILPADTDFARRYYDDSHGHTIQCSIVLSGAEQRSIHRPEGCLEGQGWTLIDQQYISIPLLSGHTQMARRLIVERQSTDSNGQKISVHAMYVYWFVGQGTTTPSEMQRVLLSNWDRVVHNRAHRWAYVSFFSLITDNLRAGGLNTDQTQALIADLAKQVVPTFQVDEMSPQAKD